MLRRPSIAEHDVADDDDDDFTSPPDLEPAGKFAHRKSSMGRSMSTSQLMRPAAAAAAPKPRVDADTITSSLLKSSHSGMLHPSSTPDTSRPSPTNLRRQMSSSSSVSTLRMKPADGSTKSLMPNGVGDPNRRELSKIEAQALFHFKVFLVGDGPYISGAGKPPSVDLTPLFPPGQGILKLSGGIEWGAALMQNHQVCTWGNNTGGQLGHGNTDAVRRPTLVTALQSVRVVKLSCGSTHGGFVSDTGALFMVGDATYGRLGLGAIPPSGIVSTPTQLQWGFAQCRDKAVSLGTWPTSIQLKHLAPEPMSPTTGAPVDTFFSDVSCGDRHTLVLVKQMHVLRQVLLGFGDGSNGRLGAGTDVDHHTPTLISTFHTAGGPVFPPIREMVAGPEQSCCVTQTGELFTWGHGAYGQLGHGTCDSEWSPKRVEYFHDNVNVTAIKQATCGLHHTVVLDTTGQVFAWGRGDLGQLGCETLSDTSTPRKVVFASETGAPAVTARFVTSGRTHNMVVDSLDNVYCWGGNTAGQLGLTRTAGLECQPTPVHLESKSIQMPPEVTAFHLHALSVFATENHTMLVLRTTSAFDGGDPSMLKAKKAVGMFKSLQAKRKSLVGPAKPRAEPQAVKWSFTVAEPTDGLKMPSNVDRFLHIMASTKIAKRPTPSMENPKSPVTGGGASSLPHHKGSPTRQAKITRQASSPPSKSVKPRPVQPIQGLLEWKRAHTKRASSTFSHTPRFRTKPAVAPTPVVPTVPPEKPTKKAAPSAALLEQSAKTRLLRAFGVGQRFRTVQVSVTPGPGAYDVIPPRMAPSMDNNQEDEGADDDDAKPKPVPFGSTAPKQTPVATVDATDIYPEKATNLVFRKPVAVKLAPTDDFSRVISKRLQAGRGDTPGPGAYNLTTTPQPSKGKSTNKRK